MASAGVFYMDFMCDLEYLTLQTTCYIPGIIYMYIMQYLKIQYKYLTNHVLLNGINP